MAIQYPIRIESREAPFVHIRDASNRVIAGGILLEDAEEIVNALNSQPKKKSKKIQVEEALRRSDLTAMETGRTDIEYGHHETLPCGEHVARITKQGG
jgi:hypothetical protein